MTGITDTASDTPSGGYGLPNSAPEGPQRLDALSECLDPITIPFLEQTGLTTQTGTSEQPTLTCLELGPGSGSILRWWLNATAPHGTAVAVELDPSRLPPAPGLSVVNHDLRTGLPDNLGGPFHLIHARLVAVHLENRHRLFDQLIDQLAPGGWLVIGEFSGHPLIVHTAPSTADAALFTTVIDAFREVLVSQHGADITWAHQVHPRMVEAGLEQVHTIEHAESWAGGSPGSRLHLANITQKRDQLLAAGISSDDLDRFVALMDDPRFSARSWQLVSTRGHKPAR
jgi:SAM-dependent methyltransferase